MLTDSAVRNAVRKRENRTLSDGQGRGTGRLILSIRAMPKRILAEWYAQEWQSGRRKTAKLGTYPELSLAEARARFANRGAMPETDVGTLAELIEGYLASLAGRPSELSMSDFLKPLGAMADRPANAITTQDLVDVLRPIYRRGSPSMADHVRGAARAAFAWAMRAEADYRADVPKRFNLTSNPAVAIPAVRSKAGERWLSVEEVRAFWRWLSAPERAERDTCKVLRLLIVTGQRGREISELRAEQYRDGCLEWATTKTGRPHILPLCPQAERILEGCKGDYLFGLVKHRAVWKTVKAYVEDTGAAEFSPRDLRRTWKTLAGHAGLSKEVRDLLQNHQRGDVSARHYDRYGYMAEKRAGVEVWGEWFYREVEGLGGGA